VTSPFRRYSRRPGRGACHEVPSCWFPSMRAMRREASAAACCRPTICSLPLLASSGTRMDRVDPIGSSGTQACWVTEVSFQLARVFSQKIAAMTASRSPTMAAVEAFGNPGVRLQGAAVELVALLSRNYSTHASKSNGCMQLRAPRRQPVQLPARRGLAHKARQRRHGAAPERPKGLQNITGESNADA
jgi:hypothetical protein